MNSKKTKGTGKKKNESHVADDNGIDSVQAT